MMCIYDNELSCSSATETSWLTTWMIFGCWQAWQSWCEWQWPLQFPCSIRKWGSLPAPVSLQGESRTCTWTSPVHSPTIAITFYFLSMCWSLLTVYHVYYTLYSNKATDKKGFWSCCIFGAASYQNIINIKSKKDHLMLIAAIEGSI